MTKVKRKTMPYKQPIGWREWVSLPNLKIPQIKAKLDTGAKTSALHAENMSFRRSPKGNMWVRFEVCPRQTRKGRPIHCRARVLEFRTIRSSNGGAQRRPVIETAIHFAGQSWPIEVSLTDRGLMGFRLLLGRQAVQGRFLVDSGRSFLFGQPEKSKR